MLVLIFAPCACGVIFYQPAQVVHLHTWWWSLAATCAGAFFLQPLVQTLLAPQLAPVVFFYINDMYIYALYMPKTEDTLRGNGAQNRYSSERMPSHDTGRADGMTVAHGS